MVSHAEIQQASACVMVKGEVRGTAWLFAEGLVLTAAHVVGDPTDGEITRPVVTLAFPSGEVVATANAADTDFRQDIALLRVTDGHALLADIDPIPIADASANQKLGFWRDGTPWHAWGFPMGHPVGLMLKGTIDTCFGRALAGVVAIQLQCEKKPYNQLTNASGAAVIANGVAIGLIRKYTPNMEEGALFAASLGAAAGEIPELTPWLLLGVRNRVAAEIERRQREGPKNTSQVIQYTHVSTGENGIAIGGNAGDINLHNKR